MYANGNRRLVDLSDLEYERLVRAIKEKTPTKAIRARFRISTESVYAVARAIHVTLEPGKHTEFGT